MRFVPTTAHAIADYLVGFIVIGLPFLYGWTGLQRSTFVALGVFALLYSLCTDYELGAIRFLRVRFHLFLDAVFGVLMLALPWVLNFSQDSLAPTTVIGVLALILVVTTKIPVQDPAAVNPNRGYS